MFCYSYRKLPSFRSSNIRQIHNLIKEVFGSIENASGKVFEVTNPSNGKILATIPNMSIEDTQKCIEHASEAFKDWQVTTAKERSQILRNWFNLLEQNAENIANVLTAESGKPLAEARGEVSYGNSFVEWFSEEARKIIGYTIPSPTNSKRIIVEKAPIGVVGLITPWNFPHAMIARKSAAALAAGCTCVIKPAEETPLTAAFMVKLAHQAGFPKGVINLVTTSRDNVASVGKLFCESPLVAGISFTGSTDVGKILYKNCSSKIKRLSLELGGNAPFIVFESANIENAINGALTAKFRNCGQTCVAANRFLVQSSIYDSFLEKLLQKTSELKLGDGMQEGVNLGPLINRPQLEKVSRLVKDAVSKGANVLCGGKVAEDVGELFFEPTILTGITNNMNIYNEEVFGPVIPIIKFETEEEAITIANSTNSGLAGYFYSENVNQIFRVSKLLETGMVGINEGLISMAEAPFGGIKESGLGREGSIVGIDDYVYIKYLCLGNLN